MINTEQTSVRQRHPLPVRIWHWLNALSIIILLMSGAMIFNAHPRLYWGQYGANPDPAWLEYRGDVAGVDGPALVVAGHSLAPSAFLQPVPRAGWSTARPFSGAVTIPSYYSLSGGRQWHLLFVWPFAFGLLGMMVYGLWSGHFCRRFRLQKRDISPRSLWADIRAHLKFDFSHGAPGGSYNSLQRWSYVLVLFFAIPLMIGTGLTMSPNMNAAFDWLLDIFGGRQSARSIHFISAIFLALFLLVHLIMVLVSGPIKQLKAMTIGALEETAP